MKATTLQQKATTAFLQGLLVMNSLIPVTSTLKCYISSSIMHCLPSGTIALDFSTPASITTCSREENVCVETHLKLKKDNNILLVNYRGCARKIFSDGESYGAKLVVTTNSAPFQTESQYCDNDLCNAEKEDQDNMKTPGNDKGSSSNSSFFKTCQFSTSHVSQDQASHPVTVQLDSCCPNSRSNVPKKSVQTVENVTMDRINASYTESPANYVTGSTTGSVPDHLNSVTTSLLDEVEYDEYDTVDDTATTVFPDSPLKPRANAPKSSGFILQLPPLLITTGISILGIQL